MERFRLLTWMFLVLFSEGGFGQSWRSSESRFQCNDGISISAAKNCNGFEDCTEGEDEQNCVGREECRPRNTAMMTTNNYTCKGECKAGRTCRAPSKACLCDDECGYSCVNPLSQCLDDPPDVEYSISFYILRIDRENKRLQRIQNSPYYFMDSVVYICGRGKRLEGPLPRCNARKGWSNEIPRCVDVACDDDPGVPGATFHYSGNGITRLSRFRCNDGFYLKSGNLSLQCSGVWNDDLPDCQPIQCGNPEDSIRATGGQITSYEGNHYNAMVEFRCGTNYQMFGSPTRRCMKNGEWSGILTVCDRNDNEERCPHPGVPINGSLIGDDFFIGASVRFECDRGYVMHGSPTQTCLWFKQWSGTFTPTCRDPKYPSNTREVVDGLARSFSKYSSKVRPRGILRNDTCRTQTIYFMFDVSDSVLRRPYYLKDGIEFAKRLVRRMESFRGSVLYGMMVFASANVVILEPLQSQHTTVNVIQTLDRIYNDAASRRYRSQTRAGTNTASALRELLNVIKFKEANERREKNMQHVFIFTDGEHTEGEDPVVVKQEIESIFGNGIEFYSVTACKSCGPESVEEMRRLSSGDGENFIVLEDFYQMSTYIDRVTDLRKDFEKCGQAGDIGSIKQQASLGRIVGGEDATENAWPWQALITKSSASMETSLSKNYLLGGGSILNEQWILTTATVLNHRYDSEDNQWMENYVVFVGIFERPRTRENVRHTVKAYSLGDYFQYSEFDKRTLVNDIALIKLGTQLDERLNPIPGETNGLTFSYYIRPVCLPCTGTCFIDKHLLDDSGISFLTDEMDSLQKCRVEETSLLSHDAKAVVTGFGHLNQSFAGIRSHNFNPPRRLQQALLKIASSERCRDGISDINGQLGQEVVEYSESMICCVSGIGGEVVDSCKGDNGGPLVREVLDKETGESCWIQIGIVSFGYRCGPDFPGYYTNVARFIPWINDTMGGILSDGRPVEENSAQSIQRCIEDNSTDDGSNGGGRDFAECGRPGDVNGETSISRVVGGQDAVAGAWPWFALITQKSRTPEMSLKKENLYGGGTIINQQWILTAAHVLHRRQRSYFVIFVGLSERPPQLEAINASVEVYEIAEYVEHSHYDELAKYDNDIALIKLGSKLDRQMNRIPGSANGLTYGPNIRAICLASCTSENADTPRNCPAEDLLYKGNAVVIGFGHADSTTRQISINNFAPPRHLQQATVRIEDRNRCQQDLNEVRGITRISSLHFTENMICCSSSRGYEDACDGDSGGPLMKMISSPGNGTTRWVQIGIVSFGYGCGIEYPGFYTDVSKYTSWIADAIA